MRRSIVVSLLFCLAASTALGSLYSWNPKKRPPTTLADALGIAKNLLGNDAVHRYCVAARLYGSAEGDGKSGAWNLYYAAEDGSRKQVYINMSGERSVRLWNGPVDWTKHDGRRTGISDVKKRLEELFDRHKLNVDIKLNGATLSARYKTRTFRTYHETVEGQYSDILTETVGPLPNGLVIEVEESPTFIRDWHDGYLGIGPYWRFYRRLHLLTQEDKFLKVEFRYGTDLSGDIRNEICDVFGEQASNL